MNARDLLQVRLLLTFFAVALAASGATAFALPPEVRLLREWFGPGTSIGQSLPGLAEWLVRVSDALDATDRNWPFLAYGTDWLAFAHLVIALVFIGPIRDPVKNIWVVEFGMIACLAVIPLALICGSIRGIPLYWRLIDCSFGVFGLVPLGIAWRMVHEAAKVSDAS
jgi:hypothetical protein